MERIFSVPLKGGTVTDVYMLDTMGELADVLNEQGSSILISDENASRLLPSIPGGAVIIPPGEKEKSWESVEKMLEGAASLSLARDSVFVGFGGGVVLDLAAFASSIYMRGARLVLVPTTLLSMVDATLGGKTGFDYLGIKNLVGTFYPAESVLIVPETLRTLPDSEFRSGLGEVVKHALLSEDARLWEFLESSHDLIIARDRDALSEMIRLSLEVKIWYITRDPEEKKGIRSALNLGHTFAHAVEWYERGLVKPEAGRLTEAERGQSGVTAEFSHGEAVAVGIILAASLSEAAGVAPAGLEERLRTDFIACGLPVDCLFPLEELTGAMARDKKAEDGKIHFILIKGIGEVTEYDMTAAEAAEYLKVRCSQEPQEAKARKAL